ncbi:putative 2-amino-3-carboxymuconate-6-semialdehyde decarboxylase [Viridothelium virens]|uniref:Putative 2-amino-3-carboxymuconate-6-semialdehyde decarboxylase n=1 Tax=Viridothelium virens TaxID=1048519 RepID=A0A6A6HCK1_VIRVR|nr:putative 2-amino-3-carboxymuconate-6-semialdehyde decarboxylase [Viridothelium virens]
MSARIPFITLEEHFTSKAATKIYGAPTSEFGPAIGSKLSSLSATRLADMDAGGIVRQVISHTPFQTAPDPTLCAAINDELHAAVLAHPNRFTGFAALPMSEPQAAASELRRAVKDLEFVGALVDTHSEGVFYDGPEWDVVWKEAQELDVPIYVHPCYASEEMMRVNYRGNYGEDVAKGLGAWVFGWHVETGLHFLRLFAAGVFDRFPRLKILLGHTGETLPFMLKRQELATSRWSHLKRPLGEVWRANVWVTTSGMFDTAPLACLLKVSLLDHVLFSIDYPFSNNEKGKNFVEDIEKEGLLTGDDLEAFIHGNAAKLLRIKE